MNAGLQDAFSDYAFQFRESLDYTELQARPLSLNFACCGPTNSAHASVTGVHAL